MGKILHYFGAGPAALPFEVKQRIQKDIIEYEDSKLSILELSHRSEYFSNILDRSKTLLRELYAIPDNYQILFMAGGATLQFDAVPLNFSGKAKYASYLDTGFWSRKAGKLAKKYLDVKFVAGLIDHANEICCLSSSEWQVDAQSAYLHVTPNETINGVEFVGVGNVEVPVVADLTSCMLMQNIDVSKFGVLYAATQKSLGIAGLSVVIIRNDLLGGASQITPDLLRYDLHVENNSIVNTIPVFACYVAMLMLLWVKEQGGISVMVEQAKLRSKLLYDAVDSNSKLINNICKKNRSTINVAFTSNYQGVVTGLLDTAEKEGLIGLQGHRRAGGVRASMYNGTSIDAAKKLARLIRLA